jgi:hypothetical protein
MQKNGLIVMMAVAPGAAAIYRTPLLAPDGAPSPAPKTAVVDAACPALAWLGHALSLTNAPQQQHAALHRRTPRCDRSNRLR